MYMELRLLITYLHAQTPFHHSRLAENTFTICLKFMSNLRAH